jgi:DNA-3-methyladenine glycosylase II
MAGERFTITPRGPFSLAEAATFGFGQRDGGEWDGIMRMAFCLDGYEGHAGVEVRQDAAGTVHGTARVPGGAGLDAVVHQVARVLSLDHDGTEFLRVGERDPVIGRLQAAAPGLRPPLFYSPYEAAAWAVLSARRPARQMQQIRQRLSEAHGEVFELAGERLAAFPSPRQLLSVPSFPGVPQDKIRRLHGVADAALAGTLDVGYLKALGPEQAMAELRQINGIGPFYSALIVIRGTGFTDVLPVQETQGPGAYGPALPPGRPSWPTGVRKDRRAVAPVPDLGRGPHPRRRGPHPRPDRSAAPTADGPSRGSEAIPRTIPRPKPLRPGILLLCVTPMWAI